MKSASKVLIFAVSFWLVYFFSFSPLTAAVVFFAAFIFVYSRQPEKKLFLKSTIIFWLSSYLISQSEYVLTPLVFGVVWLFLVVLAYWLFGLGDLIFQDRGRVYRNLNTALFFITAVLFFASDKSAYFLMKYFLESAAIFMLFSEAITVLAGIFPKREKTVALVLGLAAVEFLWAIALLPLSFFNSAALLTLLVFLMRDFLDYYFQGKLTRTLFLSRGTVFIILLVLILGTSSWRI